MIVTIIGRDQVATPDPSQPAKSSVTHVSGRKRTPSETSGDYPAVVAMLDAKTRVIECAARIQWIIQSRRGRVWASQYFCRTKAGLLLYANQITPELLALPDHFPEHDDGWQDWPVEEDVPPTVPAIEEVAS